MSERKQAEALSRYLDALLGGEKSPDTAALDEQSRALGELGRSLIRGRFRPGPGHQAKVERLLRRPIPQVSGGLRRILGRERSTPMAPRRLVGGPLRWLLTVVGSLVGGSIIAAALTRGSIAPAAVPQREITGPAATLGAPAQVIEPLGTPATVDETRSPAPVDQVAPGPRKAPPGSGMSGLAFHPSHLNAGGKCESAYSAFGTLKNHGPGPVANVSISTEQISGLEWVSDVVVTPASWGELGTSKPATFTVSVYVKEKWALAEKGSTIVVELYVPDGQGSRSTEAAFVVRNQCQAANPDKPDGPERPQSPDKPGEPDRPEKPKDPENKGKP